MRTLPAVPAAKSDEVEIAVGDALAPVRFASTVFAAWFANCVRAKEPLMVESVEVAAAYTLPLASTPSPELVSAVMWRLVVVALVVEALVAKRLLKLLYALKKFCVVVENAVESVIAPVEAVVESG